MVSKKKELEHEEDRSYHPEMRGLTFYLDEVNTICVDKGSKEIQKDLEILEFTIDWSNNISCMQRIRLIMLSLRDRTKPLEKLIYQELKSLRISLDNNSEVTEEEKWKKFLQELCRLSDLHTKYKIEGIKPFGKFKAGKHFIWYALFYEKVITQRYDYDKIARVMQDNPGYYPIEIRLIWKEEKGLTLALENLKRMCLSLDKQTRFGNNRNRKLRIKHSHDM
ncbi:hypothetical protein NEMIN01_1276 [Nematocida minor]|uniref:uncharacterized protein n=1 Tax=Nematocida minor TaxID=1912983 RepID=UPI0022205CD5|nr:uncharacterized protein NEMIN01_1276 [Nematocida minor]KAI5190943.1 hypothetical protein NEMIN01_1276 [Nematocida minor]